ncbi:Acg family FMN-binding oxidoreductase [Streptomyces sp. NPDC002454]
MNTPAAPHTDTLTAPPTATREAVEALVADAITAPSMHNAQPWLFRFDRSRGVFQLRADPDRRLALSDPEGRATYLGCGAALFNLRVAAAHAGWKPVTRLLPDRRDPYALAEVTLDGGRALYEATRQPYHKTTATYRRSGQPYDGTADAYDELADLYPALRRRRTTRTPFSDEPIDEQLLGTLRRAALVEGARLAFPDDFHRDTVLELGREAEQRTLSDAALRAELASWTGDDRAVDGIPTAAFGPRARTGYAPVRDFAAGRGTPQEAQHPGEAAEFERTPRLALLGTHGDSPIDWLHAGQALERVLLEATLDGLVTSLASEALEWDELRWAVRDPLSAMSHVQMVIRFGYGEPGPAAPRRPVGDVLTFSGAPGRPAADPA